MDIATLIAADCGGGLGLGFGGGWPNPAVPDPTKTTYIYDSFTDTDGVLLENHMPNIGGAWSALLGSTAILSNRAGASGASNKYTIDAEVVAVNIQLDAYMGNVSGGGNNDFIQIAFRQADVLNLYTVTLGKVAGVSIYKIAETTSGTGTDRATGTWTYASGAHHVLRLEDDGTVMTATIDGANPITYSSTTKNTNTKIGHIMAYAGTTVTTKPSIDNFWGWK